ncbi:hypothetical protein [Thermogymnomonas acidicola]|nr:hypothetical protein [Thermogymnomonas acidicola]
MRGWDTWEELHFHMVLAYNDSTNFLINTGLPEDLSVRNREMVLFAGERAVFEARDSVSMLSAAGFRPEEIRNLSVTPIQDYTVGRMAEFRNARIFLPKRGWVEDVVAQEDAEIKNRDLFMPPGVLSYIMFEARERLVIYEDVDSELVPGIRAIQVGCHHRSSVIFVVRTPAGEVAFTDAAFKRKNVETMRPIGIAEDLRECLRAYRMLKGMRFFALYDPDTPEGDIA